MQEHAYIFAWIHLRMHLPRCKYIHTCFIVSGRELVQHFSVQSQDLLLQDGRIGQAAPLLFFIFLLVFFSVSPSLSFIGQ